MKRSSLIIILIFLIRGAGFGQSGCFTFETDTIGCVPFFVRVINCFTPGEAVSYNFDLTRTPNAWFQAPISNNGDTSTTYAESGTYVFAQALSGQFDNPFRRRVRVYNQNVKPLYVLNFCLGNLSITLPDTIFKNYVVTVAGVDYPKPSSNTLVVPIVFGPGETRKRVPFTVRGEMSTNCGDNLVRDTAIIYSTLPVFNVDTVQEQLGGNLSTFSIGATSPALARVVVRIRDAAFAWDTVVQVPGTSERLAVAKSYPNAQRPVFSVVLGESCPGNVFLKDSILGILARLSNDGTELQLELPAMDKPYDQVQASLNGAPLRAITSPYQGGTYRFPGEKGCLKPNCLELWYTDMTDGQASRFSPAQPCVTLSGTEGTLALLKRTLVRGSGQVFVFEKAMPLKSASLEGTPLPIVDSVHGREVVVPYGKSPCYPIQLLDSCDFDVAPEGICALRLNADAVDHLSATLRWSRPRPLTSPINFFRLKVTDNAGTVLNTIETGDTVFTDRSNYTAQPVSYIVEGFPDDSAGNGVSISNLESVLRPERVVLPSAFSPNGDGSNDSLAAYIFNLKSYDFKITNRWGEIIHFKEYPLPGQAGPKSRAVWDGRFKGRTVPSGSYFATVTGRTYRNEKFSARQLVQVIQ